MMKANEQIKNIAIEAALVGGEILKNGFGSVYKISSKEGKNNLVTEYDFKSQDAIIKKIKNTFPTHIFLAEEESDIENCKNLAQTDEVRWIIDPLDGTVNFAHSLPIFSVSIAAELHNEIICGVVYQPMLNELFVAERSKGATLNNNPIYVNKNNNLDSAFCVTGFPYSITENRKKMLNVFSKLIERGSPVRRLGSAALDLAYVAAGRFDFFWEDDLKPWDVAAGTLLVEEAGGRISQYNGEKYTVFDNTILATNDILHNSCLEFF